MGGAVRGSEDDRRRTYTHRRAAEVPADDDFRDEVAGDGELLFVCLAWVDVLGGCGGG